MKKIFLIALFALMAVALNSNAQNNTYNMVIEMANGTKITIGPNDVKNISFNNGELVISGESINTLAEEQKHLQNRIDSIYYMLLERIEYLQYKMMYRDSILLERIEYLQYIMEAKIDSLMAGITRGNGATRNLIKNAANQNVGTLNNSVIQNNLADIDGDNNERTKGLENYITKLLVRIEALEAKLKELSNP